MVRTRIRVDLRSKVPAYLQIVEQIRALAAGGGLEPGERLPTIRQVAEQAHINFNTVARAYRILDAAGVISTQHGRGTFAVAPPPSARARKARRAALQTLGRDYVAASGRLGATPAEMRNALDLALGGEGAGRKREGGG
jgi:GntR family transcriptional regulator